VGADWARIKAMSRRSRCFSVLAFVPSLLLAVPALAASCQKEGSFDAWLRGFRAEAADSGISERAIADGLAGVRFDAAIVKKDRAQGVFTQDFLTFSDRMVNGSRLKSGAANIAKYKNVFARIEKEFGVPAAVLVAFWGLETDFGANIGNGPTLTSLATLAYDCRRPDMFRKELLAALVIIDRGDLAAAEMRGPWAGELGQVQFLATRYVDYGVDYDGDGRVDMLKSAPDALASAAKYLVHLGWRPGEPWLREVRVPETLPWEQADISIKLPIAQWAKWGVTLPGGKPLTGKGEAALHLPMGRNGPAFLAYPNFDVYLEWNNSLVYSTTAAYLATRLAGAGKVDRGRGVDPMSAAEVKAVQQALAANGYDVGKIDGVIGSQTRAAIKEMQQKFGLPADSYPDHALLARLRGG
jgi:lytic murein transglycosylase